MAIRASGDDASVQRGIIPLETLGEEVQKQVERASHITPGIHGAKLRAPMQDLEGEATREGLWLTSRSEEDAGKPNRFRVRAVTMGRGSNHIPSSIVMGQSAVLSSAGTVCTTEKMVSFVRPGLIEEYSASADGVRQDFIVTERLPGGRDALTVMLEVTGARAEPAAYGAMLKVEATGRELAYSRLKVTDATGRELPARMHVDAPDRMRVEVEDSGAVYPVRIDPTFSDADWVNITSGGPGTNDLVQAVLFTSTGDLYIGGEFTTVGSTAASFVAKWDGSGWSSLGAGVNDKVWALAEMGGEIYVGGQFTQAGGAAAARVAKWNGTAWSALAAGRDGQVRAFAVSGSTLYAGGFFTGRVASWNGTSWATVGTGANNTVHALAVSGSNLYAGGDFTTAGGNSANRVARWDGSAWSAMGTGMNQTVFALAATGSDVYAGGLFTTAGGVSANFMARWNGSAWSAMGTGMSDRVYAVTINGTDVYAGGQFNTAGGNSANFVARWNGSAWSALGTGASTSTVFALDHSGSWLAMGGSFTSAGGFRTGGIAAWNGTSWSPLGGSGTNGQVHCMLVSGTDLYVGGDFTTLGGVTVNRIARWNGNAWSTLGSGMDDDVYAMVMFNGQLHAGGEFDNAGGTAVNQIARWNGSEWSPLGTGVTGHTNVVRALVVKSSGSGAALGLYAAGDFDTAGGVPANRAARWDGSTWAALGSGVNGIIHSITTNNTNVYAVGSFSNAGGTSASNIARWNGTIWLALGSGTNGTAHTITAAADGTVYLGGDFTIAGGLTANGVARWNGTNSWQVFGTGVNGSVRSLMISGTDVYAGGLFTTAGGNAANGIAKWNGTAWSALGTGIDNTVFALAMYEGEVMAGGLFQSAGGAFTRNLAGWDGTTWAAFNTWADNPVDALVVSGTTLYAGGRFTSIGGVPANRVAKWDGSRWSALGTGVNDEINALAMIGTDLYAGGAFTTAGGTSVNRVAKWNGTAWSALGTGVNGTVNALAAIGTDLYAGGSMTNGIMKWNGTAWLGLGSGTSSDVNVLAVMGTDLFVGGLFTTVDGVISANRIAKWNGSAWSALGSGVSSGPTALAVIGTNLYVGGIATAGGTTVNSIAQWNGGSWSALGTGVDVAVRSLAVSGTDLYAGGTFFTAGGVSAQRIAKWNGSVWSALGSGADNGVSVMATDSHNRLFVAGSFDTTGTTHGPHISAAFLNGTPNVSVQEPVGVDLADGTSGVPFGIIAVGSSSAPKTFTITNTGTGDLMALAVAVDGPHAANFTINTSGMQTTVAPGGSTTFTVTYSPSAAGERNAALHVTSNQIGTEASFDVALHGDAPSTDANLSNLVLSAGTLSPAFSGSTTSYTSSVTVTSITVTPTTSNADATVTVNGVPVTSGSASDPILLNIGSNVITTVVTAENGTTTKTYTVTVSRPVSTNADLAGLSPSAGTLTPAFSSATLNYSATVPLAVSTITVTPTVADSFATVRVNGNIVASGSPSNAIALNAGSNPIDISVTAEDNTTTKVYTLNVNRVASSNANLSNLAISAGTLTPAFAPATTSYAATVPSAVSSLVITATLAEIGATMTVHGAATDSGVATAPIPLAPGNNTINTVVTAENGAVKTYVLNILRMAPEIGVELGALNITDGSILPVGFGEVSIENTTSLVFTIRNAGDENLTGLGITLEYQDGIDNDGDMATDEPDEAGYTVTVPPIAPVAPGGSTTFTVQFDPNQAREYLAVLHIANNDADEAPFDIAISGSGRNPQRGVISIDKPAGSTIIAAEGTSAQIPIIRTGGSDGPVGFSIGTADDDAQAGSDFTPPTVLHNLADGQTTLNVPISILNPPSSNEPNEDFTVNIHTPTGGATMGAVTSITVRIADSVDSTTPAAPVITSPAANATVNLVTSAINITGTATDNKGVGRVKVKLNAGAFVDADLSNAGETSTPWSLSLVPRDGANTITVQSFDTRNNASTLVTRSFTVLRLLAVTADASLGSVTAGFAPSSYREAGKSYTIVATPKPPAAPFAGALFTGWTLGGQDVGNGNAAFTPQRIGMPASALAKNSITFIFREGLTLEANFVLNPFTSMAGAYHGLIRPSTELPDRLPLGGGAGPEDGSPRSNATEGKFTGTVQNTGAFSGTLTLDGVALSLSGAFDHNGDARFGTARSLTQSVARTNKPGLLVALHLNVVENGVNENVPDKISGTVVTSDLKKTAVLAVSTVDSDRAFYNGSTRIVPAVYLGAAGANGTFTAVLPAKDVLSQPPGIAEVDYPQGYSIASVIVTKSGAVTVTGTMADGAIVSASSALTQGDAFPLFVQFYSKLGFLSGVVQLDSTQPDSDLSAVNLRWLRPFQGTSHHYPNGWAGTIHVDLLGAKYGTTTGQSVLKASTGGPLQPADGDGNVTLHFTDGQLTSELIKAANLSTADGVVKVPDNDPTFTLMINRVTGGFSGVFDHTDDTKPSFNGIILQKGANAGGFGYFLTKQPVPIDYTGESGGVRLIGEP